MKEELETNSANVNSKSAKEIITIINNIIKSVLILGLGGIIFYKLLLSDLGFDFSKFDFSDLLALILALFSIGLSVVFYFKATDTSNQFYDNTYKFTKDISEILGRIEAGFGERLKHLDEGYSGLKNKFDGNLGEKSNDIEAAKKGFEEEKKKLEIQTKEKEELLQHLMNKAKLSDKEKQNFIANINEKDVQIGSLTNQLNELRRIVVEREDKRDYDLFARVPPITRHFLTDYIRGNYPISMILEAPLEYLKENVKVNRNSIPNIEFDRLNHFGIINNDGSFTSAGLELIKGLIKRING